MRLRCCLAAPRLPPPATPFSLESVEFKNHRGRPHQPPQKCVIPPQKCVIPPQKCVIPTPKVRDSTPKVRDSSPLPGPWPGHVLAIARPWPGHGPAMARPWPGKDFGISIGTRGLR